MCKLTDSEDEFNPADDEFSDYEWQKKPTVGKMDKKQSKRLLEDDDLSTFFSDMEDDPFFSSDEDEGLKTKQAKRHFRDLASGKTLNNSFGGLTPDHWDHLHVDKGANPQFDMPTNQFI